MLMSELKAAACKADQRRTVEMIDLWETSDLSNSELVQAFLHIAGFEECGGCPECSFIAFSNYAVSIPDTNSKTCRSCEHYLK